MAICQNMIWAFIWGDQPRVSIETGELYGRYDLETGIDYAEQLLDEGEVVEPFHGYNLRAFIDWARRELEGIPL